MYKLCLHALGHAPVCVSVLRDSEICAPDFSSVIFGVKFRGLVDDDQLTHWLIH